MTSVVAVASFPPPVTGQTVATDAFVGWAEETARVTRLNLADPERHRRPSGRFSWSQLRRVEGILEEIRRGPGWDVGYLTAASSPLGRLRDVRLIRALRPRVGRLVVHVHQGSFGGATGGILGVPTRRVYLRHVDRVLFLAPALAARAPWVPADRVRVVPNPPGEGARFSTAEVEEARARRLADDAFRVLFLANPLPEKGHRRLLEAIPALLEGLEPNRRLQVDVVGAWATPAARRRYEERARALGAAEYVTVHGGLTDRGAVRSLLAGAHVLAFPSTYREEGAPLAVIEALGAGTPVVATPQGALPDLVEPGRSGWLLPDPAPEHLARALLESADRQAWARLSRSARAFFEERFAPEAVRAAFLEALLNGEDGV
ncbi:MAG: glycosyltransferase family 4 protein [Gemmatimonadota bacterium]